MEQQEKLKLLRGLYFLSQDEMAKLAVCQRSYYAGAESNNKLPLQEKHAENLQRHLGFDAVWFAGSADKQPLISNRLLQVNLDWGTRLLGVTANVRSSRIRIAETAVAQYFPKLLADVGVVACYRAEAPGGGRLILFMLGTAEPQALLLSTIAGQKICAVVEEIAAQHAAEAVHSITDKEFAAAAAFSKSVLAGFVKRCNLTKDTAALFNTALAEAEALHFNYEEHFGGDAHKIALRRILQDMENHGISIAELAEAQEHPRE